MVRRSAFLEAGGFSDHAFIGGEEELLAVDLADPGLVALLHPRVGRSPLSLRRGETCASRAAHASSCNALWFAWLRRPLGMLCWDGLSARPGPPLRMRRRGAASPRLWPVSRGCCANAGSCRPRWNVVYACWSRTADPGDGDPSMLFDRDLKGLTCRRRPSASPTMMALARHAGAGPLPVRRRHPRGILSSSAAMLRNEAACWPGSAPGAIASATIPIAIRAWSPWRRREATWWARLPGWTRLLRPHSPDSAHLSPAPYGNWRQQRPGTKKDRETSIVAELLNGSGKFRDHIGPVNWDISAADYDFWKRRRLRGAVRRRLSRQLTTPAAASS